MDSARARDRRAGIWREDTVERAKIEVAQERAKERQRESRLRREKMHPVLCVSPWRRDPGWRLIAAMLMA